MFGMGGTEILVILIVALLFLGPDKLPDAAKTISKGIRDLRKQTRDFRETIESDEKLGGAIRDLRSALNGEEVRARPKPRIAPADPAAIAAAVAAAEASNAAAEAAQEGAAPDAAAAEASATGDLAAEAPSITLPPVAGEPTPDAGDPSDDARELAALVKPADGVIAKGSNDHG
jgi:sec-independent protein translocase protein TatB